MASKFRVNRYNWFGQKLLNLHRYSDIISLKNHLTTTTTPLQDTVGIIQKPISDHLSYIYGLALMKTGDNLEQVIDFLQRLDFDRNSQYFLLLCQCLLYLGNYESVVALCKQIINKEIDSIKSIEASGDLIDLEESSSRNEEQKQSSKFLAEESSEFRKIFENINKNPLINEPKLWFIFGLALEFQRQYKDAWFAFKISSKLSIGSANQYLSTNNLDDPNQMKVAAMSNYYNPHLKYAEYCIKYQHNYKTAVTILVQASQLFPQNYHINRLLSLAMISQPSSNVANIQKAVKTIVRLESFSNATRNPALGYNNIAQKFKQKSYTMLSERKSSLSHQLLVNSASELSTGDEFKLNLNYLLTKAHVILNGFIHESNIRLPLSTHPNDANEYQISLLNQADKLIEAMKSCNSTCWSSASLWNNMGVCFLIRRRYIACLSCFLRAYNLNPLDWRINYNVGLAFMHIGLLTRAFNHLIACKNLIAQQGLKTKEMHPIIATLLAICYEQLDKIDEARKLHYETIKSSKKTTLDNVPIASLVNYLIFLHKNFPNQERNDISAEQNSRLKLHLLDQLEQCWLQRNQNDPQFNVYMLDVAKQIGLDISSNFASTSVARKSYAWTKVDV